MNIPIINNDIFIKQQTKVKEISPISSYNSNMTDNKEKMLFSEELANIPKEIKKKEIIQSSSLDNFKSLIMKKNKEDGLNIYKEYAFKN